MCRRALQRAIACGIVAPDGEKGMGTPPVAQAGRDRLDRADGDRHGLPVGGGVLARRPSANTAATRLE